MPVVSEPTANAVAQVTESTPLTTPCETPRSSAPCVESGYIAVAMIVKAGRDGDQQQELRRIGEAGDQQRGHDRQRDGGACAHAQRADALGSAPRQGPETAPNAAPIMSAAPMCQVAHAVAVQMARDEQIDRAQ